MVGTLLKLCEQHLYPHGCVRFKVPTLDIWSIPAKEILMGCGMNTSTAGYKCIQSDSDLLPGDRQVIELTSAMKIMQMIFHSTGVDAVFRLLTALAAGILSNNS